MLLYFLAVSAVHYSRLVTNGFVPFQQRMTRPQRRQVGANRMTDMGVAAAKSSFAVPSSELEKNLSTDEKTVVSVVRRSGPSVAFVTSILPALTNQVGDRQRRIQLRPNNANGLPNGQSLGSGSGFVVDSRGYIVTNFHVVEQAYRWYETNQQFDDFVNQLQLADNTSSNIITMISPLLSDLLQTVKRRLVAPILPTPEVYVRLDSISFQKCTFVDVRPDLDLAVLKLSATSNATRPSYPALSFGSSSDLLVGQSLVAIGNPFGLDNTVTTGVVSALNRKLTTGTMRPPISNCIQTDCAINPGNSGGPLLNLQGQVVGVNTAIVSTTGSNAGIGFAISSDQVAPVVRSMIRKDDTTRVAWLGISILKEVVDMGQPLIVAKVATGSPAAKANIRGIFLSGTVVRYGDAIVAVAGNTVASFDELQRELMRCVVGEQLAITVEDVTTKERRILYLKLEAKK